MRNSFLVTSLRSRRLCHNMNAMKWKHAEVYMSAAISVVSLALMLYGTVEFYRAYLANLDTASALDTTYASEGGDVVLAIRQRAMAAGTYTSGVQHALAIIGIGAVLQCALVYRLTRSIPAAVRALLQVEMVYQAITAHRVEDGQVADIERREAAATVVKMGNFGIYFGFALHGLNITASSVFQRPLRSTINGRDLISVWTGISMVLAALAGLTMATHLANAVWSVWYVRPVAAQNQSSSNRGSSPSASTQPNSDFERALSSSDAPASKEVAGVSLSAGFVKIGAVLRVATCIITVMAHITTLSIMAVSIRGLVVAIAAGYFVLGSLAYYAATRQPINSMFWGYLSIAMHLAFNRNTHRKAWWLSLVWAIMFSTVGIVCGALQSNVYLFTRQYSAANTSLYGVQVAAGVTNSNLQIGPLPLEKNHGIFTACMAAADLLVYLTLVMSCLRNDKDSFEASVQLPTMPVA